MNSESVFPIATDVPSQWQSGDQILDLYQVAETLGEGGMGKVYRVYHKNWDISLAVKSPHAGLFQTDQDRDIFIHETRTWVNLGLHPHIVTCYYVRTLGHIPRLFAEYMDGGSLKAWITSGLLYEGDSITVLGRILDIAIQTAWGLDFAHKQGLVHRDVKPANIMMSTEGKAKVTDFSLAQAQASLHGISETAVSPAQTKGMTVAYCSPEQAAFKQLTFHTDIWSWAVSVLEMFTGAATWVSGKIAAYVLKNYIKNQTKQPDRLIMPAILAELLQHCFQTEPDLRPSSIASVALSLQEIYRNITQQPYFREIPDSVELKADSLNNRALSLWEIDDKNTADKLWQQALQANPSHIPTHVNLTFKHWQEGSLSIHNVRDDLHQLVDQDESNPYYFHTWLALLDYLWGHYAAALARIQPFIQRSNLEPHEWNLFSALLYLNGYQEEAVTAVQKAIAQSPHHDGYLFNQALYQNDQQALETYTGPDQPPIITPFPAGIITSLMLEKNHPDAASYLAMLLRPQDAHPTWTVTLIDNDTSLNISNKQQNQPDVCLSEHLDKIICFSLTAQSNQLVSAAKDRTVFLWDTLSGELLQTYFDLENDPKSIGFVNQESHIWVFTETCSLFILDAHTLQYVRTLLPARDHYFSWACTDRDGRLLIAAVNSHIHIWDTTNYREIRCLPDQAENQIIGRLSPDQTRLVCKTLHEQIWVYTLRPHTNLIYEPQVVMVPAIARPRSVEEESTAEKECRQLLQTAKLLLDQGKGQAAHNTLRQAQALPDYARDQRILALLDRLDQVGGERFGVRSTWHVIDIATKIKGEHHLDITPDGTQMIVGTEQEIQGGLHINLTQNRVLDGLNAGEKSLSAAIDPQKRFSVIGSRQGNLHLFAIDPFKFGSNLAEAKTIIHVTLGTGRVADLSFAPDGQVLAVGLGNDVQLLHILAQELDNARSNEIWIVRGYKLQGCGVSVRALQFSLDGRYLIASTGRDGIIGSGGGEHLLCWDVKTGELKWQQEHSGGWTVDIATLSAHPIIATVTANGILRILSVRTGREIRVIDTNEFRVACAALSGGKYVLLASSRGDIDIWDIRNDSFVGHVPTHRGKIAAMQVTQSNPQQCVIAHEAGLISTWQFDWEWGLSADHLWD